MTKGVSAKERLIKLTSAVLAVVMALSLVLSYVPFIDGIQFVAFADTDYVEYEVDNITDLRSALSDAADDTSDTVYKITVTSGTTLWVGTPIFLPSNVYLIATGARFEQSSNNTGPMILFGEDWDDVRSVTGYATENVTIEGGTYDMNEESHTMVQIGHAANITITGATFANAADSHLMEVAGVNGITISDCTFKNQTLSTSSVATYEAIQLDILYSKHFNNYVSEDLPTKNVVVTGCTFSNVPRGVGSHTAVLNNPTNGVEITNNTFKNTTSTAISITGMKNVTISGNTITGCPRGIVVISFLSGTFLGTALDSSSTTSTTLKSTLSSMSITIKNNSITLDTASDPYDDTLEYAGIMLKGYENTGSYSQIPEGNYYIKGVTVSGNTIVTKRAKTYGIRLNDAKGNTVKSNTITYSGSSTISSESGFGISSKASTTNSFTSNTIKNYYYGIHLFSSSTASSVSSNTISGCKYHAIMINGSYATKINSNTISSCSGYGIYVYSTSSSSTITINSNKITGKSKSYNGIQLNAGTVSINSNTIKSCKYPIYASSKVKGGIYKNSLSGNSYNKYYINGKTYSNMSAPSTVKISAKTKSSLTLKWSKVSGASGYVIYRSKSKSGSYSKIKAITSGSTKTYKNSSLSKSTTYYYKVRSYKKAGNMKVYSACSSIKSGKTTSS